MCCTPLSGLFLTNLANHMSPICRSKTFPGCTFCVSRELEHQLGFAGYVCARNGGMNSIGDGVECGFLRCWEASDSIFKKCR